MFTHFALTLEVFVAEAPERSKAFHWLPREEALAALPTVFAKALRAGVQSLSKAPIRTSSKASPSRSASSAR